MWKHIFIQWNINHTYWEESHTHRHTHSDKGWSLRWVKGKNFDDFKYDMLPFILNQPNKKRKGSMLHMHICFCALIILSYNTWGKTVKLPLRIKLGIKVNFHCIVLILFVFFKTVSISSVAFNSGCILEWSEEA